MMHQGRESRAAIQHRKKF